MKSIGLVHGLAGLILVTALAACGGGGPPGGGGGSSSVVAAASGNFHTLALTDEDTVLAWGSNHAGQLGTGGTTGANTPVAVPGLADIVAVAAGHSHSLALGADGTVYSWGLGTDGQLGRVAESSTTPTAVALSANITAIAASDSSSFALDDEGGLWAWGNNSRYNLGDGTTANRSTPAVVAGLPAVASFAVGYSSVFVLTEAEGVWAWGLGQAGSLGTGNADIQSTPVRVTALDDRDVVQIAAGAAHALALLEDGSLIGWGTNQQGQLGQTPGSPVTVLVPTAVPGVSGVEFLAAAPQSTAVIIGGQPVTWGSNLHGVLGVGLEAVMTGTPSEVDLSGVVSLATGSGGSQSSMFAVHADGTLSGWGWNFYSQLGLGGSNSDRDSPVAVPLP